MNYYEEYKSRLQSDYKHVNMFTDKENFNNNSSMFMTADNDLASEIEVSSYLRKPRGTRWDQINLTYANRVAEALPLYAFMLFDEEIEIRKDKYGLIYI